MDDHQMQSDKELMLDYQQGHAQALEILFGRYHHPIFNFCLRILRNRAEAEDAAAEVFMKLCTITYHERADAKFSTWLFTIARNECLTRVRRTKNMFPLFVKDQDTGDYTPLDVPDERHIPGRDLEAVDTAGAVQKAIDRLPWTQKEAIILREYHELPYDDIAKILNCSAANVKILIFRARERLKQELPAMLGEEQS